MKMHIAFAVIVTLCVASVTQVNAFPAQSSLDDDAEVIVVPLEKQYGNRAGIPKPVQPDFFSSSSDSDESDSIFPGFSLAPVNPFRFNFRFFDSFEDIMRRMRDRVSNVWNTFPTPDVSSIPFGGVNLGKPNTTSTVQIINGHKVVVNDTTYENNGDFGNSLFKVRIINVQPVDDEDSSTDSEPKIDSETISVSRESTETKSSPEVLDSKENAIGNNDDIESFEPQSTHLSSVQHNGFNPQFMHPNQPTFNDAIIPNRRVFPGASNWWRPSSQFNRQNYMNQRRQPVPYFQQPEPQQNARPATWESIEDYSDGQHNFNSHQAVSPVDAYESVPIDLSNDIDVNQMLADQGAPHDPDAEVFAPETFSYNHHGVAVKK